MKPKSRPAPAAARHRRTAAELRALRDEEAHHPMMSELRRRAESQLRKQRSKQKTASNGQRPAAAAQHTLHELQVHQIELEMQNTELQQARDWMERLVEKYTDLYDFAPVGYFSLDEKGMIQEVNLTGAGLLGVERSRLINTRFSRFVAPASQPDFLAFLKQVFAGTGQESCDVALVKEDGTDFWTRFRGTAALSPNESGKWCRVSLSDITAVKQAGEILRRSEALFSALIQQAPLGVFVVDDQLRLQQVNPEALPLFKNVRPLSGRDFSEVIRILWPEKVADGVMEHLRHTLKTGQSYASPAFSAQRRDTGVTESYEWQLQRIISPAGHQGVVCFFSDITARKRAEAAQRRAEVLAASNQKLEAEIVRRKASEEALKKSDQEQRRLLKESRQLQGQLRLLSHQILHAQEEERKRISRELHDEVAQTLTGINLRLSALNADAVNVHGLQDKIAHTQRLVEKSVEIVHRFARELRPSVLDDLGLIPALHAFMKTFAKETKLPVRLRIFAGVEQLDIAKRTVLYRVAQEALTNVARHARATEVELCIEKLPEAVCMKIMDNGRAFSVQRTLLAKKNGRLGLLGMRERVEMIGGRFTVESAPGHGTTIEVQVPSAKNLRPGKR